MNEEKFTANDFLLDPDQFILDKEMIRKVIKSIKNRWRKSDLTKIKNAQYIAALTALEGAIYFTNEEVLKNIWFDIMLGFNNILLINAQKKALGESPNMKILFDITMEKLESGELFEQSIKK